MKKCKKCGAEKARRDFYTHRLTADGLNSYCKACTIAGAVGWQKENKAAHAAHRSKWNVAHPGSLAAATKKWVQKNPERVKIASAVWNRAHPEQANRRNSRHRAEKVRAVPQWTDHVAVGEFYAFAALKTRLTGEPWHVDHIVPLRSKLVNGLHTHYNLQVIKGRDNARKGNRFWPDMP